MCYTIKKQEAATERRTRRECVNGGDEEKMINIGIVEDNDEARKTLEDNLSRYSKEKGVLFNITAFPTAGKYLGGMNGQFDIVFMDIELPDGNGMELIKQLRKVSGGGETIVIFVTNLAQYAVKGYEVRAFDFIVKPISYFNFAEKLTAAIDYYTSKQNSYIWVSNREGKSRLSTSRIKYVEVRSHTLIYHTLDGDIASTGSLGEAEKALAPSMFSLCNRCFLVNLRYVTTVKDMSVFLGDEELQISHTKRASFMKALTDYCAFGV